MDGTADSGIRLECVCQTIIYHIPSNTRPVRMTMLHNLKSKAGSQHGVHVSVGAKQ